jgi:phage baseplate assembly protein gpV
LSDDLARLVFTVADLERRLAGLVRHGRVHEVKDGFIRVEIGKRPDGQPWLSPWLAQGDTHFGNVREEQPYKVGQNVTLICPGGDPAQATLLPYSPNDANKRPDHADDETHTYQWGDLKGTQRGGDDAIWRWEIGQSSIEMTAERVIIKCGDSEVEMLPDNLILRSPMIDENP